MFNLFLIKSNFNLHRLNLVLNKRNYCLHKFNLILNKLNFSLHMLILISNKRNFCLQMFNLNRARGYLMQNCGVGGKKKTGTIYEDMCKSEMFTLDMMSLRF